MNGAWSNGTSWPEKEVSQPFPMGRMDKSPLPPLPKGGSTRAIPRLQHAPCPLTGSEVVRAGKTSPEAKSCVCFLIEGERPVNYCEGTILVDDRTPTKTLPPAGKDFLRRVIDRAEFQGKIMASSGSRGLNTSPLMTLG